MNLPTDFIQLMEIKKKLGSLRLEERLGPRHYHFLILPPPP